MNYIGSFLSCLIMLAFSYNPSVGVKFKDKIYGVQKGLRTSDDHRCFSPKTPMIALSFEVQKYAFLKDVNIRIENWADMHQPLKIMIIKLRQGYPDTTAPFLVKYMTVNKSGGWNSLKDMNDSIPAGDYFLIADFSTLVKKLAFNSCNYSIGVAELHDSSSNQAFVYTNKAMTPAEEAAFEWQRDPTVTWRVSPPPNFKKLFPIYIFPCMNIELREAQ